MRLDRINYEKEEDEKDDNKEKEEEEVEDDEKGETNEQEEEEQEQEEEEEEEVEDYENSNNIKEKSKKKIKIPNIKNIKDIGKNRPILKIIIWCTIILIALIIIIKIILDISRKAKKKNISTKEDNEEIKLLNTLDSDRFSKIKDYLIEQYNSNGEINLNKFQVESISQKEYKLPENNLNSIHISASLCEENINDIITHLSSVLYHLSSSSFLHIHLMNAGNFTIETYSKLMNMVLKINNNTEIIVYNAQRVLKDFKIREDKVNLFSKEYARILAIKVIKGINKVIMLNIDNIMVEKDLNDLYNINMEDVFIRGINEVPFGKYKVDWMDNYLYDKSHFINGDVILVNLELCQREDFYHKAMELNNNEFYSKCEDPVQDIFNVLMRKKIEFLEPKFNKINFYENPEDKNDESKWYPWVGEAIKFSEKNNHFYTKEDLLAADGEPFIVNYYWDKQLGKNPKKLQEEKEMLNKLNGVSTN